MDKDYYGYRMMLRDLFPEYDTKRVFVINGSPGSGKTTFVKSKIKQRDIALDFDKLTAAIALDDELYGDRKPQLRELVSGLCLRRSGHASWKQNICRKY